MRILQARFHDGDELLRSYLPALDEGGLFFPTREPLSIGAAVAVEVRFPSLRGRLMLRGTVAWRRAGRHRTKLRAGVGIAFDPTEARKRDFLLQVARGGEPSVTARRHRRLPVAIEASFRAPGLGVKQARIDNIGAGGALLATGETLAPGTELVLDVTPPGALMPLAIAARVAWARDEGVGVAFRCRDAGGARRLRELVRRLETGVN